MSACRTATGRHAFGVNAQLGGVCPNETHGGFSVRNAFERRSFIAAFHAVLGRDRHHAAPGKVLAMWLKLLRRAAIPAAAKEKYNSRPCIGGLVPFRVEHVQEELGATGLLVLHGLSVFKFDQLCGRSKRQCDESDECCFHFLDFLPPGLGKT